MTSLAEIFRRAGPAYRDAYGEQMLPSHMRAMNDIVRCRTAELGGSVFLCKHCGAIDYAYHSCRNRHCPRCQQELTEVWREKLRALLLPCRYALVTFTLPSELRRLARSHQRLVYSLLLRAAAASILAIAHDPDWVGGQLGIVAILHTWARNLAYHVHVHLLVTVGGLSTDGLAWRLPAHRDFFLPGYAISVIFRAKVRDALDQAGLLDGVGRRVFARRWTVQVKNVGDGKAVSRYLARYVYRVALTDESIEHFQNGNVTFRYVHTRTGAVRRMTLPTQDFIARFLQHVLPFRFVKVRYYGLFAPSRRHQLELARELLVSSGFAHLAPANSPTSDTHHPVGRPCPVCKQGRMVFLQRFAPGQLPTLWPSTLVNSSGTRAPP